MKMENILQSVSAVVGVTGYFVCDGEGRVLASVLPDAFDKVTITDMGRTVTQTIAGLETTRRRKVGDLDLLYRDGRLVVKNLRPGCLAILCVPTTNVPLLNLTANLAVRKLRETLKEQTKEIPQAKPAPPPIPPDWFETTTDFIESLIEELEKRGIGRNVMLKAVQHRAGRLQTNHPCLALVHIAGGRVNLSAFRVTTFSDEEAGTALGALIQGMCWSAVGILGAEEARAGYDQIYELFREQNGTFAERIESGEVLFRVASKETKSCLPGVDLGW